MAGATQMVRRWDIVGELTTDTLEPFDEVLRQIGKARRGSYRGLMAKSISTSLTKLVVTFMPPAE